MKRFGFTILALLLFVVNITIALAQDQPPQSILPVAIEAPVQDTQAEEAAPPEQPATIAVAPSDYKLQEEDGMRISVYGEPNLTSEVVVDPKGYVRLPLAGQIYAQGLTQQELIVKITEGLSKYLVDPKVSISMVVFRKPKVQLTGQFNRPGQFEFKPGSRIMDAVALAGSYTDLAYLEGATLTHKNSTQTIPLNLKDLYTNGNLSLNVPLQDGDTIHLPEDTTNWYFVLGEVQRPGKYRLKDSVTVVDAATQAVFLERARKDQTYIIRGEITGAGKKPEGEAKPERIQCNLDALLKKADMSQNIALMPGDVVYVPETKKPNWTKISQIISTLINLTYIPRALNDW